MKNSIWLILFLYVGVSGQAFSQEIRDFNIYIFNKRYNSDVQKKVGELKGVKGMDLISGYMIDPKKNGGIDLESVNKYVTKIYPNKNDGGLLCINLENKLYQNLKSNNTNTAKFKESITSFVSMLSYIKNLRPNVKIGIYGLPFRTFGASQVVADYNKLDPILKMCDYIFPSLYIIYPDKQISQKKNDDYFIQNLDAAFRYSERLKKPVLPFVWYLVHPLNKVYGYEMISKNEMKRHIDVLKRYRYKNSLKINGVVWWDTPTPFKKNQVKYTNESRSLSAKQDYNDILMDYIGDVLK